MLYNPKSAPITGNGHILMQFKPTLEKKTNFDFLQMKEMEFYHLD